MLCKSCRLIFYFIACPSRNYQIIYRYLFLSSLMHSAFYSVISFNINISKERKIFIVNHAVRERKLAHEKKISASLTERCRKCSSCAFHFSNPIFQSLTITDPSPLRSPTTTGPITKRSFRPVNLIPCFIVRLQCHSSSDGTAFHKPCAEFRLRYR